MDLNKVICLDNEIQARETEMAVQEGRLLLMMLNNPTLLRK